jgi:predicted branched-subunit amino acid permease
MDGNLTFKTEGREQRNDTATTDMPSWGATRARILSNALALGLAAGAFALSCGAVCAAAGLSLAQTVFLSGVMFTGASQFALAGILLSHGSAASSALTALLLGSRNAFYGLRLSSMIGFTAIKRFLAAQFVVDETTAMTIAQDSARARRYAFWTTAVAIFTFWNIGCLLGALGTRAISDPKVLGLDAAGPAAFLALLAPRIRGAEPWILAVGGACMALFVVPFVPGGVPVLFAALVGVVVGLAFSKRVAV